MIQHNRAVVVRINVVLSCNCQTVYWVGTKEDPLCTIEIDD